MKDFFYKTLANSVSGIFQTPKYLILFVSNKCWMKCKHCWFSEEWKCDNLKEDSLTFEELNKLSASVRKMLFLSITGGEAFGRNDIEEVVKLRDLFSLKRCRKNLGTISNHAMLKHGSGESKENDYNIYSQKPYFLHNYVKAWQGDNDQLALFLILPLGCIWFSDAMGGYTGMGMGSGAITSPTPGFLIAFVGWLLLLLPIILALVL